jgi:transcriptional regulator with XRE-family HTH domain
LATRKIAPARLKALRQTAGITQVQLSELCRVEDGDRQVHTVTICNYETGTHVACYELTAHILATGLSKALKRKVDPEEFLVPLDATPDEQAAPAAQVAQVAEARAS